MATHSSILAWTRIPWTEEPGGLQSMGCRVRHDQSGLAYRNMQECVVFPNEPLSSPRNLVTYVGSWVQQEVGLANTVRTQSPRCKFGGG